MVVQIDDTVKRNTDRGLKVAKLLVFMLGIRWTRLSHKMWIVSGFWELVSDDEKG